MATKTPPELTQLRDIHLPNPISWWPLAPGWYLLLLSLAALTLFITYKVWHHRINGRAKRQALRLLDAYQKQYHKDKNTQQTCARISELLKRVALVYFSRDNVASLQGASWLNFLTASSTANKLNFMTVRVELLEYPYSKAPPAKNLDPLFNLAKSWINQRSKPCSN